MTTQDDENTSPLGPFIAPVTSMSLRDYMATHAPASEIDGMMPKTIGDSAAALGLDSWKKYVTATHYPILVSRARYAWADAMMRVREEQ